MRKLKDGIAFEQKFWKVELNCFIEIVRWPNWTFGEGEGWNCSWKIVGYPIKIWKSWRMRLLFNNSCMTRLCLMHIWLPNWTFRKTFGHPNYFRFRVSFNFTKFQFGKPPITQKQFHASAYWKVKFRRPVVVQKLFLILQLL